MPKRTHHLRLIMLAAAVVLGITASSDGQATKGSKDDEQTIRKSAEAYSAAYNKGDVEGIMAQWSADAEYVDEAGKVTRGRAAIAANMKKSIEAHKGYKLKLTVQSLRFLKPDVALEDGLASLIHGHGSAETGRYLAVWTKTDGKWLLSSVRDLGGDGDTTTGAHQQRLKQLDWLVGDWEFHGKDIEVHISCRWAENQSFLLQEYSVKHADHVFSMSQRIGWDPTRGQLRSWFFDAKGGFGEGSWARDGHQWTVEMSGVLPDGRTGSARNHWRFIDHNTIHWQSKDRAVDEQPIPDTEARLVRKKP